MLKKTLLSAAVATTLMSGAVATQAESAVHAARERLFEGGRVGSGG